MVAKRPQAEQVGFDFVGPSPPPLDAAAPTPSTGRDLTVTGLHIELKRALHTLGEVRVTGEVHGLKRYPTGSYLTLKDRAAQISVRVAPAKERFCRTVEGETVVVTGRLETYSKNGTMSLMASNIVPVGVGAVAAMIEQARERLRADGLLDRPRRLLVLLPRRIALVCGNDAAVLHDVMSVINGRYPGFPVEVIEVSQSSPESIIEGLERAADHPEVDAVILARGGGDTTQLLPYSNEFLCRVVASCRVPVVSAIGHEINRPLCDEVADYRAATPSVAAAMVVPDKHALQQRIDGARDAVLTSALRTIDRSRARTDYLSALLVNGPQRDLDRARRDIDTLKWASVLDQRLTVLRGSLDLTRCNEALERSRERASVRLDATGRRVIAPNADGLRTRLTSAKSLVDSLSPMATLQRGFSVVSRSDGSVVRNSDDVSVGDQLIVELANGRIKVEVRSHMVSGESS